MLAGLRRDFRLAPLTFLLLAGTVLLFLVVEFSRGKGDDRRNSGRHAFGSVERFEMNADHGVYGPFDLWQGPWWRWWRIPASAFHHGNLLHLVCNISMLWYLGPLLERRMGWWRYLAFWLFAALVPLLPEYLLEQSSIGLSGLGCAMFGWCLVEREFDSAVANRVHDGVVKSTWMFLVGCIVVTTLGLYPIANVAHFAGVGYGWLVARGGRWRSWRLAVRLGHVIVVPLGIWLVLHPFWNARYHAYCGVRAAVQEDHAAAERHYREATRLNSGLSLPWHELARAQLKQDNVLQAWRISVDGLKANRSSKSLTELVQYVWQQLPKSDRAAGRKHLETAFAGETEVWIKRLQLADHPVVDADLGDMLRELFPGSRPDESGSPPDASPRRKRPKVDPDQNDSAAEGQLL